MNTEENIIIYLKYILSIFICYGIGCISAGYYITYFLARQDIRKFGSGSTGARNVGRVLGSVGFFAATFLMDVARGLIAASVTVLLHVNSVVMMFSMLALLCGHIWPIQLKFRGGKGIAVIIGFLLFFDYKIIGMAAIVFILMLLFSQRYEMSMFISLLATPAAAYLTNHSIIEITVIFLVIVIILLAHKNYILKFIKHPDEGI
jgi:glycerol-3-phosphate acyltransferase PlsY